MPMSEGNGESNPPTETSEASDESGDRTSLVEEVEPEEISARSAKLVVKTHHPPPPPRLRAEKRPITLAGEPKVARDLMTRQLYTIGPDDVLESLEDFMQTLRFRHLPVVDDDKLVGLISHADLLHASSSYLTSHAKEVDAIVHKLPAKRIMHVDFTAVRPTAPLREVAEVMWDSRAGCVLVTDEEKKLLGIITQGDFVRLAHHLLERGS
jgi:CBS domain-containing membrane protein